MSESSSRILRDAPKLLAPVAVAYDRRYKQYGASPRGVFWKDENWQVRRFEVLACIFDDVDAAGGLTIHDFGCGYGAFFDFLRDRPEMYRSRYIGTEMSEALINAARARIGDPRATFRRRLVVTETTDYTFASGTFNMHLDADNEAWAEYVEASLVQLWVHTRKGLAFNMLRADAADRFDGLYYADGEAVRDFCARQLSADVTITNDDPLPDFTVFVKR